MAWEGFVVAGSDYQNEKNWPTSIRFSELNQYGACDTIRVFAAAILGGPKCEHCPSFPLWF